ncbi:Sperm flagellar protein 1 [Rhizoclosmatium hyalinum]|nr:Sperm flagellar protein 1 [Rhizoclosmatium hyalinum]
MNITLTEEEIASLLAWIDEIPISKPKKNITRDFSDGVATAEVIHHFCPKLVELFMYSPANAVSQKMYNWNTLNQKVFRKLGYLAQPELISCIVANKPGYVEFLLYELRQKVLTASSNSAFGFVNSPSSQIEIYASANRQNLSTSNLFGDGQQYLPPLPNNSYYGQQQAPLPGISGAAEGAHGTYGGSSPDVVGGGAGISGAAEGAHGTYGGSGPDVVGGGAGLNSGRRAANTVTNGALHEKDVMIHELQETIQMLQIKVTKLEQLLIVSNFFLRWGY